MAEAEKKTRKCTVVVPQREGGHDGWWAVGRKWTTGTHEDVELTEDEIANIAARPGMAVLIGGRQVTSKLGVSGTPTYVALTNDEAEILQQYRAEKTKNPSIAKQYGGSDEPPYTIGKGKADVGALADQTRGEYSGISGANEPLQHREVLRGQPPPSPDGGETGTVKPIPEAKDQGKKGGK